MSDVQQKWPEWLEQMPAREVLRLIDGGSTIAADYLAWCHRVSAEVSARLEAEAR